MAKAIHPNIRWLIFAAVLFASGALALSAVRHALAARWAASSKPELLLRAAEMEPANPEFWYQLGRYRQFDLQNASLSLAISYYRRAISLNPASAFYWMDLADAYEASGDLSAADQAFRTARTVYPKSAQTAWRFGNFLLRHNRIEEGFAQFHEAVVSDPSLSTLAVSRCWRATHDFDRIFQNVLPDEQDANWGATQFFVEAREPVPATALWNRIAAHHDRFPASRAFPLLDMLIETGSVADAATVWPQALAAAGIVSQTSRDDSVVWNGGFEAELLNGGFDWRVTPAGGARMALDDRIVHSGKRSLRVDFNGSANIDFENIWQYVLVRPGTNYRFSAFVRTGDLSTDSGIRFEIRDVSEPGNPSTFTENALGTQGWTADTAEFATGPKTKLLKIVLRRLTSKKLAGKIHGTAWVDDVALVPLDHHSGSPR